jgi:hypothetical protein
VTDLPAEAVEAAARALHARRQKRTAWDELAEYARQRYRDDARAALTAAVPLLREAWETELRESGALVLPPNPFGTSATRAVIDWNGLNCLPGCNFQDGHDGDCMTDEDVAEGRLRARDYEGWAAL